MRIVCGACGRDAYFPKDTVHFICACGAKLLWFGEKGNYEIKKQVRRECNKVRVCGNLFDMTISEKTRFFEEKYPLKQ